MVAALQIVSILQLKSSAAIKKSVAACLQSHSLPTPLSSLQLATIIGYDYIFARQIEALCRPEDLVIGITTSGNSKNVVNAIIEANSIGATTVGLTGGTGGKLTGLCKFNLVMPSNDTPRIQEAHIFHWP